MDFSHEKYFEQKFYHKRCSKETTIHEGWSVVCLATHLAILMGSTQVYLLGIDLAYTEEKEYAAHAYIEKNSYVNAVKEKDWFGLQEVHHQTSGPILTRWRWLAEQEYLSEMLSFFSPRITSYNLSSHGLEIKGSIQSTLKEILLDLRQKDYEGKKHLYAIQSPKVSWEKAEVKVFIESVADNTLYLQNWFETQLTNFDEIIDRIKDSKTREYCYILLFRNKISSSVSLLN